MPVLEVPSSAVTEIASERTQISLAWWAVVSRFLLHGLIVSTWVSRIPAVQSALRLTNAGLGLCLLGTAVGSVIAVPVTGWLVTRFGSKRVTTWSTAGFCLALIAPSLAVDTITLFAALTIYGAMAGANDVSINSQAVAVEAALGKPTMSRFHAMFSIGGMIGAILGGLVAANGVAPRLHLGIGSALFLIVSSLTAPYLLDAHDDHAPKRESNLSVRRIPGVLITLTIIGFCMFLSEGAMADWTAVYLRQVLSTGAGLAAAGYAVFSAGMAMFRLLGDTVTKRLGPVLTVRTGALVAAFGLSLALIAPSPSYALPGLALTGAGFSVIVPLVFGAGGRVRSLPRGAGIAMVSGSGYIGFLFGPPLIGFLAQMTSLRAALFLIVGLSVLAAVLAGAVRGAQEQP
ncbi:MAG TPA: MFS transporter [Bryobacteraceae bacterium]|jgi:MFS family permease|nr:MFS transporter [Bryobacteraceae bacterium]